MTAPEERPRVNGAATATAASLRTVKDYVGGRWVEPKVARWDEVKNPATGETIARVPMGGAAEVDAAVKAAAEAFPAWRRTSVVQRARYFFKLKTLMDARVGATNTTRTATVIRNARSAPPARISLALRKKMMNTSCSKSSTSASKPRFARSTPRTTCE